ncbi:MAG: hypothetical protein Q9163_002358 [Psora crenata]
MMEYRKVGRGGAGNYYSPQDVQDVQKRAAEVSQAIQYTPDSQLNDNRKQRDTEAQRPTQPRQPNTEDLSQPRYATSGRGGAGNLTDTCTLAAVTRGTVDVTAALQETKPPEAGHYGRGGAGNYCGSLSRPSGRDQSGPSDAWEKKPYGEGEEIEMSLREPEKAHLGGERLTYDTPN